METWIIEYLPEARREYLRLDGSIQKQVAKMLRRVSTNPESESAGGYGKPLGNKLGRNLTGVYKIKLRSSGLRVLYVLQKVRGKMTIVIVGARADAEVYREAAKRLKNHPELRHNN